MSDEKVPAPFVTYHRFVEQRRHAAVITAENIGQIAAIIGGSVDYSRPDKGAVLMVPSGSPSRTLWPVFIGERVELMLSPNTLSRSWNNQDTTWTEVTE